MDKLAPRALARPPRHAGGRPGRTRRTLSLLAAGGAGLSLALLATGPAQASIAIGRVVSTNPANFTPQVQNGAVHKFLQVGGTMYAGGSFTSVTAASGTSPSGTFTRNRLLAFNPTTGSISTFAPSFNGEVWALATDGTSLYVGGSFSTVNGVARRGLAKLEPVHRRRRHRLQRGARRQRHRGSGAQRPAHRRGHVLRQVAGAQPDHRRQHRLHVAEHQRLGRRQRGPGRRVPLRGQPRRHQAGRRRQLHVGRWGQPTTAP